MCHLYHREKVATTPKLCLPSYFFGDKIETSYLRTTIGLLVDVVGMVGTPVGVVVQSPIVSVVGVVVRIPIGGGVQCREGARLLRPGRRNVVRWWSLLQTIRLLLLLKPWVVLRLVVEFCRDKLRFDRLLPRWRCMRQRCVRQGVRRSSWSRY